MAQVRRKNLGKQFIKNVTLKRCWSEKSLVASMTKGFHLKTRWARYSTVTFLGSDSCFFGMPFIEYQRFVAIDERRMYSCRKNTYEHFYSTFSSISLKYTNDAKLSHFIPTINKCYSCIKRCKMQATSRVVLKNINASLTFNPSFLTPGPSRSS